MKNELSKILLKDSIETKQDTFKLERFKQIIQDIKYGNRPDRQQHIKTLISLEGLLTHHKDKNTSRLVLATFQNFQYSHEEQT